MRTTMRKSLSTLPPSLHSERALLVPPVPPPSPLLVEKGVRQWVADLLGLDRPISRKVIRKWRDKHGLPHKQLHKRLTVYYPDLVWEWLLTSPVVHNVRQAAANKAAAVRTGSSLRCPREVKVA